jgi:hypothetical protein
MKSSLPLLAFLGLCAVLSAKTFQLDGSAQLVAGKLQAQIPSWSCDRLMEARRLKDGGWQYSFWTDYGKTWVDEVRITIHDADQRKATVDVKAVKIEGGMFTSHAKKAEAATNEWSAKIEDFLKEWANRVAGGN